MSGFHYLLSIQELAIEVLFYLCLKTLPLLGMEGTLNWEQAGVSSFLSTF